MSKRGSGSSTRASGGTANEHEFESFVNGKCPAEFDWNVTKIKPFQYERRHYRE